MDRTTACQTCVESAGTCSLLRVAETPGLVAGSRKFKPRTLINRRGQSADHMAILCEGYAIEYCQLADGRRQVLGLIGPGAALYWPSDLAPANSILAISEARIAQIPMDRLAQLAAQRPGLFAEIVRALEARRLEVCELAADIGRRTAVERVCRFLLKMARDGHATLGENNAIVRVPLRREEIADLLGMTATHVTRVISSLRDQGLLSVRNDVYTLRDIAKLTEVAG